MLPRKNRIRLKKEFDYAFNNAQSFYNNFFGFKVVKNQNKEFRLGIILGNKVNKKAVIRNKIKRQIRHIVQSELQYLQKGYDVVVIVLPQINKKSFLEIKEKLLQGFKKLGLY